LSLQPGAALGLFAVLGGGARLGGVRAGAPRRTAESIGRYVVRQLVAAIDAGATLDRFAADQLIPYAALADGETRVRIVEVTPHVETAAWLAREFLDAEVRVRDHELIIRGCGHRRRRTPVDDGPAASAGAAGEAPPRGPGGDPEGGHST
ncbi:MAG: RNA 3'-terminal phosphate cyclase, partial [Dehalococcoidia bacterium]